MDTLELFAGEQSFTNVAKKLGHKTFCSDIEKIPGIEPWLIQKI